MFVQCVVFILFCFAFILFFCPSSLSDNSICLIDKVTEMDDKLTIALTSHPEARF